ncbi:MAG: glycosyltransferase family 39 protein [Myxococcota bacterium]
MTLLASMARRPSTQLLLVAAGFAAIAIAMRLFNAISYPPDWGFDSSFNLRYILRMSEDWALPSPEVGWSTSDPPLYFTIVAAIWALVGRSLVIIPLVNTAFGLGCAALAVAAVHRLEPDRPERALLAGGLLLFLPANIYMSVMVNEEILVSLLTSITLFWLAFPTAEHPLANAARVGFAAGLATLTKLPGVLAAATAAASYGLAGLRERTLLRASRQIAIALLVAGLAGGWFYARNRVMYGYFQPEKLPIHEAMFDMPPGERSVRDYFYVPLATWTDPKLTNEDLLHSVWGSTYATAWFDGHRFLLPRDDRAVRSLGTVTLLLALLPTVAFAIGLLRGARRLLRDNSGPDAPLLIYTALALTGYAYFTWVNPYFAVVKGTSLLSLSLPFAIYASETLAGWMRHGRVAAMSIAGALAALAACVVLGSTFNLAFEKTEVSGLPWAAVDGRP